MSANVSPSCPEQEIGGETKWFSRLRELAIGLALLGGTAYSIALAVLQQTAPSRAAFIGHNELELPARLFVLNWSLRVAAAVAVGLAVWSLYKKLAPASRILRWSKIACPLLIVGFLPPLFTRRPWRNVELEYLVLLGAVGLLFERLLSLSLQELAADAPPKLRNAGKLAERWLDRAAFSLVCAGVLYYAVLVSHYTLNTHILLATHTSDLGEYDNLFFNALQGRPFRLPSSEGNLADWGALKYHAEFVLYLLLPFYALKPGPQALLIMQTVAIAGTAVPIFLFAARRLPRWMAAVVALSFLQLPAIQRPNFYDFHFVPVGMFFAAWAIWGVDRILHDARASKRHHVLFWSAFALACLSREDVAFGMIVVSLFVVFYGRAPKLGLSMLASSGLYFVVIKFVLIPSFGVHWFHAVYDDIKSAGLERYTAVVATMLTNPVFVLRTMLSQAKLLYVLHFLVPLLFLWVRRPYLLVAALPSVFFSVMVTNRPAMFESSFQYTFQWFPYVVIASILALHHIRNASPQGAVRQTAAVLALGLVATAAGYQYGVLLGGKTIKGGPLEKRVHVTEGDRERHRQLQALIAQIPADASVAATETEGPHVSTRLDLYRLTFSERPDYLLFDKKSLGGPPVRHVRDDLKAGTYGVVDEQGPFVLARRGHDTAKNAMIVRSLRRK